MTLSPAYDDGTVSVYHCGHAELAEHMKASGLVADALIVDAPYSERTHSGHDSGTDSANRLVHRGNVGGRPQTARDVAKCIRRPIAYAGWTTDDVSAFVDLWAPLVCGWCVSLTDHILAPAWEESLYGAGRYVFSPLACVESGSRIRLSGDGPAQWSCFAVVARPRSRVFAAWGALPGAYVGGSEAKAWVGGKPVWLIRALVRDYSRPGDTIVDPCCGAGTLGVAVRYEGRKAILCDRDPAAVETTIKRLRGERTKATRDDFPETKEQPSLFGRTA